MDRFFVRWRRPAKQSWFFCRTECGDTGYVLVVSLVFALDALSSGGSFMAFKRSRMSRGGSRRDFRRKSGVHGKNLRATPMRGGIRL